MDLQEDRGWEGHASSLNCGCLCVGLGGHCIFSPNQATKGQPAVNPEPTGIPLVVGVLGEMTPPAAVLKAMFIVSGPTLLGRDERFLWNNFQGSLTLKYTDKRGLSRQGHEYFPPCNSVGKIPREFLYPFGW